MSIIAKKIYQKLFEFQKKIRIVDKDSQAYGYKYASLDNIIRTITPALEEAGLIYYHTFTDSNITCTLVDAESGDSIESSLPLLALEAKGMNSAQAQGASITYARRYTLTSILGLVTDEDTDANISQKASKQELKKVENTEDKKWLSKDKYEELLSSNDHIKIQKALQCKEYPLEDGRMVPFAMRKEYREALNDKLNQLLQS